MAKKTVHFITTIALTSLLLAFHPASASGGTPEPGVFRGSGKPDQVKEYETWLGKKVSSVLDFVGRAPVSSIEPWKNIDNPAWWCNQWKNQPYRLVLSVAILPNTNFSLAQGARGTYNDHWKKFASSMVSNGCGDTTLRLGWEFNGKFYPWAAGGKEASFAAYWRQIVDTIRSVPGQKFIFDWTPLAGSTAANVEAAWPGSNYVDVLGLDAYDTSTIPASDPQGRWQNQLNRPYGLVWHAAFAQKMGKPLSFPEWGITVRKEDSLGGGDNPSYLTNMWNWFKMHDVAYNLYFEVDAKDGDHRLMTTQFPKSSAEYRRLIKAG